ncbi:uncharacterized protein [Notamacropus eugenii]|uniref:uncharacterized protein n=1 Tax=Notamacropus eugenii TaxID=9315 RepID=UPI003B66C118
MAGQGSSPGGGVALEAYVPPGRPRTCFVTSSGGTKGRRPRRLSQGEAAGRLVVRRGRAPSSCPLPGARLAGPCLAISLPLCPSSVPSRQTLSPSGPPSCFPHPPARSRALFAAALPTMALLVFVALVAPAVLVTCPPVLTCPPLTWRTCACLPTTPVNLGPAFLLLFAAILVSVSALLWVTDCRGFKIQSNETTSDDPDLASKGSIEN